MPRYSMTGRDGRLYTIDGPAGLSRKVVEAEILKRAPEANIPPEPENALERTGPIGNALAYAADIPLTAVEGLTGMTKSITDAFGANNAVSQAIGSVGQYAHGMRSSESLRQEKINAARTAAASGKGTWEEIKAAGKNFFASPAESTASLVGSAVPFIGASLATEGAAAPLLLGAVSGAGTIKGDIYDAMYRASRDHGATEEQAVAAATKAQDYDGQNLDQIALGAVLGAIASATGLPRQISSAIGRKAAAEAAESIAERELAKHSVGKAMLAGAAEEAVPEAVQEGQEQYAENIAQQRAGYDVNPFAGVAGRAAAAGITSLLPGAYGGRKEALAGNANTINKEYEDQLDALPDNPTEDDKTKVAAWAVSRGFSEDEAKVISDNIVAQKERLAKAEAELEAQKSAAAEERTVGAEPSAEPNINAPGMPGAEEDLTPPPTDQEEQAAMQRAYEAEAAPVQETTPEAAAPTATSTSEVMTPSEAQALIDRIENNPAFETEYEAQTGRTLDDLYNIAGGGNRYSRGRRAKDTETSDMFGALPIQQAPGESLKRDEFNAQRFAPAEEKAALQEQALQETEANQERAASLQQRETEHREETLGDIEYALRAQAPENAVYKVLHEPEDSSAPYKLVAETQLGKKPETILKAKTLQDFSDQVYGQMAELTPFIPETPSAVQDIEAVKPSEQEAPTPATRMVQDFVKEVDAAREAGQINNNQRAQLLARLQRPNAYKTLPNGRQVAGDAIAKLEEKALAAASAARNASAAEKEAAEVARVEANHKLRVAVKNGLLNPARAALKTMVEMRQDEKAGATHRIESAKVQERLGKMEGADTAAEQREIQSAKVDLAQQRVSKYRQKAKETKGTKASAVQRVVDKVSRQWKSAPKITVVQSVNDIADLALRRAVKTDDAMDANGFVTPSGEVYLIADNIDSEEHAKAVLFHEALGHAGLSKLFRNNLDSVLTTLYNGNAKFKAEVNAWRQANPGAYARDRNPLARAAEEVLAERSEAGQLDQSIFQKVANVVRNFMRRAGFNLAVSDNDINAILDMAHQQVVNGTEATSAQKGMRYMGALLGPKYSRTKTTKAEAKKLQDSDERLSDGARKVNKSNSTQGIVTGLEEMASGHSSKDYIPAILNNWNLFSPAKQATMLKAMPSSGILGWVKPNNKTLYAHMVEIDERVHKMNALKQRILAASDNLARRIEDFSIANGTQTLAKIQHMARINEVDPFEFKTADEALKSNKVIAEIESRVLSNTNDKVAASKLLDEIKALVLQNKDSLHVEGDKYKMSAALESKFKALDKLAIDAKNTLHQVQQLSEMVRRIRDIYAVREELSKQEGGERLYKEMRAYYKDMFNAELALLDERISSITDKDEAIRIKDMRAKLMREIVSEDERKKSGDIFWDINANLFTKDYFPFMREGKYWLRVNADKGGKRERELHTFDTERQMLDAQKKIAARLGVDPERNSGVLTVGFDIGELQETLRTEDALMQRVFDIVGKTREKYERSGDLNLKELTDSIYQTWLMTTPERSVRRRLMHAEEVVGFSPDIFRHFRQQATAYANQLSKLTYAGQIKLAIDEAREGINDPERPVTEKAKWNAFVSEFERRADQELRPDPQNALLNLVNHASYFYYLTSAKTAFLNLASIPLRVVPRLWRDYGYVAGTGMWIKYMKLWGSLGRVQVTRETTRYGDKLDALMPSINGSHFVKNSADLQWAMKRATEQGLLETVHDTIVQNERTTTSKTRSGTIRTVQDIVGNTAKTLSFLFNGMENISRQAAFYMTFELAIAKHRKDNPDAKPEEARDYAFKQAKEVTYRTLGDFSSWERPSIAKNNMARALFLFKMHPMNQTRFMVGAVRDITRGTSAMLGHGPKEAKAEAVGAIKELTGVLGMAGLFGGVMGMPLYSAMIYSLMAAYGPDKDDDDDVRALMGGDPRTAYDPDIAFRTWMNDKFGATKIGGVSLADILTYGPISAATNTDLSSSTSIDLKNMWFRDAVAGDNMQDTMVATAVANIAGYSMAAQILRGIEDYRDDNIKGALTKLTPAFFRSWVTAAWNADEGVKNRRGDVLIPKEDIRTADTMRDLLGMRAPKLGRIQEYYITRAKNEKRIDTERGAILDSFERKVSDGDFKSEADFKQFMDDTVVPFNRTYPDPNFIITMKTLADSIKRRSEVRALTVQGVQLDKKTAAKDLAPQRAFVR